MDHRTRYAETLKFAARTLGGEAELARRLAVPQERLHAWIEKQEEAPLRAFLDALDVIADGPFPLRREKKVRVAVIRDGLAAGK